MFAGAQNAQLRRANQLKRERSTITIKDVSTVLQLVAVVLVTLFLAGIAAPSFLRAEAAGSHALASASLHTLTIARVPFTYTFWNLASAILGALFGAAAVLAISSPARPGSITRIGRPLCQMAWKWLGPNRKSRPSYISGYLMNPAKAQRKHTSSAPNLLRLSEALRLQRYRDAPLESSRAISDKTEIEVCR